MTVLQKPDNMSDEDWEDLLEAHADTHSHDCWDTLEELRKLLNNSQLEAMAIIKKQSRFGNQCPYYLKALKLFNRDTKADIFSLLGQFQHELLEQQEEEKQDV